jgi:hypothetical protein
MSITVLGIRTYSVPYTIPAHRWQLEAGGYTAAPRKGAPYRSARAAPRKGAPYNARRGAP